MLIKAHLLRCPLQALPAAYRKYASVVPLRAPCIWTFLNILVIIAFLPSPASSADNLQALKKDFLKGRRASEAGKGDEALRHYLKIRDLDVAMRDYILFYLGKEFLNQRKCDDARQVFQELAGRYPESRWTSLAAFQAISVEPCPPLVVPSPEEEKIDCETLPQNEDQADCFFRSRQYRSAKGLYRQLAERGGVVVGKGIFYLTRLSQAAARTQDFETAIWANETLRSRYPKTEAAQEAYRKIASLLQDSGDYRRALPLYRELLETARSSQERRYYWEKIAWCHFRLGEYSQALQGFEEALGQMETPFSLYWKGRSLELLGKKGKEIEPYRLLADIYRGNYYGIRALERIHGEASPPSSTLQEWWSPVANGLHWERKIESVQALPEVERIYELASLGLFQDASVEIRRVRGRLRIPFPGDPKKIRKDRNGFHFEDRGVGEENPDYPVPYADFLFSRFKESKTAVDPFLLYGMMRQESRFRDSVVSAAGAVGILQIMPGTGVRLAKEAGWDNYDPSWLYDPLTNIELAVIYVEKLSKFFGPRWDAIAASYNAGEHVVTEWLKQRQGMSEEEFIEEIPYSETKDYVKKVYANWKAYRFIYRAD